MLDAVLRKAIDPPLDKMATWFVRKEITANYVTLLGLGIGLMAVPFIAFEFYWIALVLILINRLSDGLDGAVARQGRATDFGGYLDIISDFIFYSAIVFGFGLGHTEWALSSAFLIYSFLVSGSSFLAYAIIAEKRGLKTDVNGEKSFFHSDALIEGSETILFLVFLCLFPESFPSVAGFFGLLCWVTAGQRTYKAYQLFT